MREVDGLSPVLVLRCGHAGGCSAPQHGLQLCTVLWIYRMALCRASTNWLNLQLILQGGIYVLSSHCAMSDGCNGVNFRTTGVHIAGG